MQNKLNIQNISKSYNNKPVLRDITCCVEQGHAIGIFGPNGAGKTTLFSIIIGLIKPEVGQILLNDQDITNLPIYIRSKLGIGYLPQESSIFKGLTVQDNIKLVLEITCNNNEIIAAKSKELLEEFAILHLKDKMASVLSGGERRRLEIARLLATNPKFILFDEPLAGIDPIVVSEVKELVMHLKDRNIGILITDHNVRDTLGIIDRGYIVYDGKVLMDGTAEVIINSDQVRNLYLGKSFL